MHKLNIKNTKLRRHYILNYDLLKINIIKSGLGLGLRSKTEIEIELQYTQSR